MTKKFPTATAFKTSLEATVVRRGTHPLPAGLPPPPEAWRIDFPPMAVEARLSTDVVAVEFSIQQSYWSAGRFGADV